MTQWWKWDSIPGQHNLELYIPPLHHPSLTHSCIRMGPGSEYDNVVRLYPSLVRCIYILCCCPPPCIAATKFLSSFYRCKSFCMRKACSSTIYELRDGLAGCGNVFFLSDAVGSGISRCGNYSLLFIIHCHLFLTDKVLEILYL